MARIVGHKRGCGCVGCSPATRAKGMRALRRAVKAGTVRRRRKRNPDARTVPAAVTQLIAKANDYTRALGRLHLGGRELELVENVAAAARYAEQTRGLRTEGWAAWKLAKVVDHALADKGLRRSVAASAVAERAQGLLENTALRAGRYLGGAEPQPEHGELFQGPITNPQQAPQFGPVADVIEAGRQIVWKLSHNFDRAKVGNVSGYTGPALVSRQDATIRMLAAALEKLDSSR